MSTTTIDPIDRLLDAAQNGKTLIKNRDVLHFTFMPNQILHRDPEQEKITQSLLPILMESRPSNLLVYGKPGTGKTLVIKKVLSKIQKRVEEGSFPIKLAYTNAKQETTLYGLLVSFGRQLGLGSQKTNDEKMWLPSTGLSISEVFNRIIYVLDKNETNAVFVIDEIDYLAELIQKTGKDVLYQITRANERLTTGSLTLIGVSNDLTFKERLDPRVISTLSEEEVIFTNYNLPQIKEILDARIEVAFEEGIVSDAALNLCSAMAGRESGDARRALDLLRVAAEIAERSQVPTVTEEHIRMASEKIEENKEVVALRSYPLHEKLLILAIMKSSEISTGEVYSTYKNLCKDIRQKELTQRRVTQMLSEIEMSGIITGRIVHQGTHGNTKKFRITVSPDMVKTTFKDETILEDIL
ncbi:MAG TPA: AAA family ATPase [Candidatus Nitrosopelagicus sp.]|mgnify:FL=1|jgi:cell division control protein 6|nr:AAA family ATPase [Candidatus Nitrosopelagicus sp.]HJM45675.1 AAA family ATPase [Candidatus Nitrosopelagicus sp.]